MLLRAAVLRRRHRAHRRVATLSGLSRTERVGLPLVAALTVLAGIGHYVDGVPRLVAFVLAGLALGGSAWITSFATEEVGARLGEATTGILQATLGNLPEFFVVLFALRAGELVIAQTAILGSILVNALLVLGSAILVGAHRAPDGLMRFSPRVPNDTATLLIVVGVIVLLVALAAGAHDPASHHLTAISVAAAGVLLVVYGFSTHRQLTAGSGEPRTAGPAEPAPEPPRLPAALSLGLLGIAGVLAGFVSDWFVAALMPTIHDLHISEEFAGLVIVAIAGNAVEHAVGVVLAARGRSELSVSVIKASVGQVSALLFPILVIVSLATSTTLTFALPPVLVGALAATAVLMWQITGDGEASVFEGAALIGAFVVIAVVVAFE